ncbi:MAG: tetratricopeptide repeat protein, partial [Oligoflexia bacterium]|nr:tetratricopeptide repeat protein [Oligoflexia bacterium]
NSTFSVQGDTSHFEISGRDEWRYDKRRVQEGKIFVHEVQLYGVQAEEVKNLSAFKDSRIQKVEVVNGNNNQALLRFYTKHPRVTLFEYQTDSPGALVLDFYKDAPQVKKMSEAEKKKTELDRLVQNHPTKDKFLLGVKKRGLASDHSPQVDYSGFGFLEAQNKDGKTKLKYGIFDGGDKDLNRFKIDDSEISENGLIRSSENIYLRYPALMVTHPYLENIVKDPIRYEVEPAENEENQIVRLMIKQYNDNRPTVALKTLKIYKEKYPQSTKYKQTLDFLYADIMYKIWQKDRQPADLETALRLYKNVLEAYPEDPSRYRTLALIGYSYREVNNALGTLSTFQSGVEKYPDSPFYWQMRMAIANALRDLNKDEFAIQELEKIESDPRSGRFAVEARFRIGDVFFKKKDYKAALDTYLGALKKYPEQWQEGPNVFFNSAESRFWLKDYKGALDAYRGFLQRFPTHPAGGYAMTRLGEIMEIQGVAKSKVTGAYLESYFRYRGTPGAYLAKVYLDTDRYISMKNKELKAVREQIKKEKPKDEMDHLDTFVILKESDGLLARKDFAESLDMLTTYYQKEVLSPYLGIFKNRIVNNLARQVEHAQNGGNFVGAINIYSKNTSSWLAKEERVDLHMTLGRAYEGLNLLTEAMKEYETTESRLKSLAGKAKQYAEVFQNLPTADTIALRKARVAYEANQITQAAKFLEEIQKVEVLADQERIEHSLILAGVAERQERNDVAEAALKDLAARWKGKPELLVEPWMRLAKVTAKSGRLNDSIFWANQVVETAQKNESVGAEKVREALEFSAQSNVRIGKPEKAIEAYKLILDRYTADKPVSRIKFELGRIYFELGKIPDAQATWQWAREEQDSQLWKKMAQEQLAQIQWSEKYKKYFDRKPAASGAGDGRK